MTTRYFVKRDGRVPQDMIEVLGRERDEVRFFPAGGGREFRMSAFEFDVTHRQVRADELESPCAYAAVFSIDDLFEGLVGYSFGRRWNGWACPYFPKESCDRIIAAIGKGARFDTEADAYVVPYDDGSDKSTEFDSYPAQIIEVDGHDVKVWPIGSGCWTWNEETR